jgi:cytochrome b
MVLLAVVHVIGVIVESRLNHESLTRAMLTGRKRA